jgi:hypothetical protein
MNGSEIDRSSKLLIVSIPSFLLICQIQITSINDHAIHIKCIQSAIWVAMVDAVKIIKI